MKIILTRRLIQIINKLKQWDYIVYLFFLTISLVCYLFYRLRQSQCKKPLMYSVAYIVLCTLLFSGVIGLFYRALEGMNYIIVGIIMIWICSKSHHSGGGGEYMYIRGWIGAITSLIYGILKILNMI